MNPIIRVLDLEKHFQIPVHHKGTLGALRGLVSRKYTTVRAVDRISFEIQTGEVVGYIGPNGAGKSTTVKVLAGLLVPSGGTVEVEGRTPWRHREQHVARIGTVFGQRTTLWWDLPVIESFDLMHHIYQIPDDRYHKNLAYFKELLELDGFLSTPVRSLSLGQRMRADLCAAMLHDPPLLFLDEPTIGLDVVAKERIRQFIRKVNLERNTTVLLTTHDLSDVEKLCQRVMIIDQGRLLFDGALHDIRARFGKDRELVVDFAEDYDDVTLEGAELIERSGPRATYRFNRTETSASVLIGRLSAGYNITDLAVMEPEIESIVRRIYEERLLA
ncbi:MAG: ATP-binding cassette domain-containing protein [Anaerolineales bacterium]|nr:ATP-binding cassette domain-containing protein [Anaerolineales bacterium]